MIPDGHWWQIWKMSIRSYRKITLVVVLEQPLDEGTDEVEYQS